MKKIRFLFLAGIISASCSNTQPLDTLNENTYVPSEPPITQSLFDDKTSTISEENIHKILDGNYNIPSNLRVAFVKLSNAQNLERYYWSDEHYLKSQQNYLELLSQKFRNSSKVKKISSILADLNF